MLRPGCWPWVLLLFALAVALPGCLYLDISTAEDYHTPPAQQSNDGLVDDRLEDRPALPFDPERVDRRLLASGWQINASAAVVRLDNPAMKPDADADLLALQPSYTAVVAIARQHSNGEEILPSVNLLDGKAKHFDDGLYAALDCAYYHGLEGHLRSHVQLIRRWYEVIDKRSPAAPFLASGLELAGIHVEVADVKARDKWLSDFRKNEVASKPIGFYEWNEELVACFRFLRFFQQEFDTTRMDIREALIVALEKDAALKADYTKALSFYARLSNDYICGSLLEPPSKNAKYQVEALLPPSTSRETVLFDKMFPRNLPPDADLMRELIQAIRSGKVSLQPGPDSGWYEHQVYALETLLLAEKGEEHTKLLLTVAYKKRMLEAFKSFITKKRETHIRQSALAMTCGAAPPFGEIPVEKVQPRLRVEPCPSYYLRTARAYAFLSNFLEAAIGADGLRSLHGLRKEGNRQADLLTELHTQRDLFYGLYLVSAEDIGLKPALAPGEADSEQCYKVATEWLPKAFADADLTADTRVAVPIMLDTERKVTRLWTTLGVRLARLDADYVRPPSWKPQNGGEWQPIPQGNLELAHYLIPVDEFAEVELKGCRVLTLQEFRAACDKGKTREGILKLLQRQ